jgi:hypothetical protein
MSSREPLGRTFNASEIDAVKRSLGQVKDLAGSAQGRIEEIREYRKQGLSLSEIGRRLGVSHHAIARALRMA